MLSALRKAFYVYEIREIRESPLQGLINGDNSINTSSTACGVRHCPQGNLLRQRVVDFVNYGSSLYSELQGGCGRWRFLSIIYYLLFLIYYLLFLAGG